MKTRITRIGGGHGVRVPKSMLDKAGVGTDGVVELRATAFGIEIRRMAQPRAGWAEAAARACAAGEAVLLDGIGTTHFDRGEWTW